MRKDLILMGIILILVIVAGVLISNSYKQSLSTERVTSTGNTSGSEAQKPSPETLVRPDSPSLGPENAKVTIVEFYDPECESCAAFAPVVKNVYAAYPGQVRLVMRYVPLHPNSLTAATFIEAAAAEGKHWEALDTLFKKQPEWGTRHGVPPSEQPDAEKLMKKYWTEMGFPAGKFEAALADKRYEPKFERDQKDAQTLGVRRTPTIFVNGRQLRTLDAGALKALVEEELKN